MQQALRCPLCGQHKCDGCSEAKCDLGLWLTCCRCDLAAVALFWNPKAPETIELIPAETPICQFCGHIRCDNCQSDLWPKLADGCCSCLARALSKLRERVH